MSDLKELPGTGILGQYSYPDLGRRPLMATSMALGSCLHVLLSYKGLGEEASWLVGVCGINRCPLQVGVLNSRFWLPIVKAGESESVLPLCLKHPDVFILPPRSLI